jgi:hypothetical protein
MVEVDEMDVIKFLGYFYFINMILFAWLYLYTMYTQYKNAHDKWYDIIKENDLDRDKTRELRESVDKRD